MSLALCSFSSLEWSGKHKLHLLPELCSSAERIAPLGDLFADCIYVASKKTDIMSVTSWKRKAKNSESLGGA